MTGDERIISRRRWTVASVAGVAVAALAGSVTSSVGVREAPGLVASLALGSLAAVIVSGASNLNQYVVAAAVTLLAAGVVAGVVWLAIVATFVVTPWGY